MGKINFKDYYLEEWIFQGNLFFPYFVISTTTLILGKRLIELSEDRYEVGEKVETVDVRKEYVPDMITGTPAFADFHFLIAIKKDFQINNNETEFYLRHLLRQKKFQDTVRQSWYEIQKKGYEQEVRKLEKIIKIKMDFPREFKQMLERNELSIKDAVLYDDVRKVCNTIVKKFPLPFDYSLILFRMFTEGVDHVVENISTLEQANFAYQNYYNNTVCLIRNDEHIQPYLLNTMTATTDINSFKRTLPIIEYFQKEYLYPVKAPKNINFSRYRDFIAVETNEKLTETDKANLLFKGCGETELNNLAKMRQRYNKYFPT